MATLCNSFLVAFGLSLFMAGQVSHGHKLFNVSLTEGERQDCPNTNCSEKESCVNNAECPTSKCCIDAVNLKACCYQIGDPTHAPATTEPQNSPQAPYPVCDGYQQIIIDGCPDCPYCGATPDDCWPGEICCVVVKDGIGKLKCYLETPPPPTPPPIGGRCPTRTPPYTCAQTHNMAISCKLPGDGMRPDNHICSPKEICCQATRTGLPCCVTFP